MNAPFDTRLPPFVRLDDREDSEGIFRRLIDAAPDAVVVVDEAGRIVLANLQTEKLFGYSRDQLMGQTIEILIPERFRRGHGAHRDQYFAAPKVRPMGPSLELFGRKADGSEFPVEISLSPVQSGGVKLTSAGIRDVTARKESEVELHEARRLAEAANSAKSEFLASMSHELRTPLNAILGFAQLLERDKKTPLSDRHRERIEHVLRGGAHLLRLIDEVLDLARIEAGRVSVSPEPVGVREVIVDARNTLEPMAARLEIKLVIEPIAADLPLVFADRTRFQQILMNYGSNAIKYGRRMGTATFRVSVVDSFVRVTIADDGMGIARDKHDKIFQPFQRAGQEAGPIEGTGIGLAITKRLAEIMHGRVGFRSDENDGSEFWIDLPIHQPTSGDAQTPRLARNVDTSPLMGTDGPRYRIVYIEDNPSNIAFMEDLLADFERVELLTAPTAEIGIELVRAHLPNVVIMDINLPGMSGFEATRRLQELPETKAIPVIALSAAAMVRDRARVKEAGFYRYLTKPVKVDELTTALEELLVPKAALAIA